MGALADYVAKEDGGFQWRLAGPDWIHLQSHNWKGFLWSHDLVCKWPQDGQGRGPVFLHVTGGEPNPTDLDWAQRLADISGCGVATLFQIPNQPLFDRVEDDLIAHTFEQFLDSGDPSWPLLLPMVKSAFAAMRALREHKPDIASFVVGGASKRGWTSWLCSAVADLDLVSGIVPMVFDNLKFREQLEKQMRDWGCFSPMIEDYTGRELDLSLDEDEGSELLRIVDPASYLPSIKAPVLMVHGANDPYWTTDALSLYWDAISAPKSVVVVPNMGHGWGATEFWTPTVAKFLQLQGALPRVDWDAEPAAKSGPCTLLRSEVWAATSETRNFSQSEWSPILDHFQLLELYEAREWPSLPTAVFPLAHYGHEGTSFPVSAPVKVFMPRRSQP
ncbi:MAG: hypothetical protein KIT11_06120 [Fimbriimonadaceae bacterium]|nr:hypothetical protein [Fimbriimonadaceae bacterium]QYK55933.1 MAG: hypothetical protein KF733_00310 [Fimbriimonadaceae bacterium]